MILHIDRQCANGFQMCIHFMQRYLKLNDYLCLHEYISICVHANVHRNTFCHMCWNTGMCLCVKCIFASISVYLYAAKCVCVCVCVGVSGQPKCCLALPA